MLAVIAVTALLLDGVDGWLARRQDRNSPYGARFDMEMDTVAMIYLSLLLWRSGEVGAWVLLMGLLRPGFVVAGRLWPWLDRPLPFSQRRRLICMAQVAVLAAAVTPLLEPPLRGRLCRGAAGRCAVRVVLGHVHQVVQVGGGQHDARIRALLPSQPQGGVRHPLDVRPVMARVVAQARVLETAADMVAQRGKQLGVKRIVHRSIGRRGFDAGQGFLPVRLRCPQVLQRPTDAPTDRKSVV
jgi:phosphatidylglycerophosphate synthase